MSRQLTASVAVSIMAMAAFAALSTVTLSTHMGDLSLSNQDSGAATQIAAPVNPIAAIGQ